VFVVLPFFNIPFVGLSVTAPLLLPMMYYAFFQTKTPWLHQYRGWVRIAAAIWLGMFVSFVVNGPWFGAREFMAGEIASLVRYLFWLTVFLVTAYLASDFRIQRRLPFLLGMAIVVLAGLRCFEGFVFGKVGAEANTVFTTQNSYGVLFSVPRISRPWFPPQAALRSRPAGRAVCLRHQRFPGIVDLHHSGAGCFFSIGSAVAATSLFAADFAGRVRRLGFGWDPGGEHSGPRVRPESFFHLQ
jgi:hypothetical protein